MDLAHLLLAELMLHRPLPAVLLCAAVLAGGGAAHACGMEDPSSVAIQRGALNIAYPQSLHVGTAVWQAQLADQLPRDPLAMQGDLTAEARAALRLTRASALLRQFGAQLPPSTAGHPPLAVVLLGPVMWNRFEFDRGAARLALHVDGPRAGDVVAVTEIAVLEAIAAGALPFADALRGGLLRLYGVPAEVATVQAWLTAVRG